MTTIWQVSGAPVTYGDRNVFIDHGVLLIGPGSAGPWVSGRNDADFEGSYTRRLAEEMEVGDAVVLRSGSSRLAAVGIVASGYLYLPQFEDVNGWDIGQARRVRWLLLPEPHDFGRLAFGANPPRLSRVGTAGIVDFVERVIASPPDAWKTADLPSLPEAEPELAEVPAAVADLVAQVQDLAPTYWHSAAFGEHPREDEFLAHYVVPMFRCLGWPVELIAVKWRDVDVTLFHRLPRVPENVAMIVEVKRLGDTVERALAQACGYMDNLGIAVPVVVTDGFRYRLYIPAAGLSSVAYANLTNLKQGASALFDRLRRP